MKPTRIGLFFLILLLGLGARGAGPAGARRDVAREIQSIRSFTYYPFARNWQTFDLKTYEASLDEMKKVGANAVWLVLPWVDFQPQALPSPVWNEQAVRNLDRAVGLAEERGIKAILPLCYLGAGWSPQGIDARFWTLDPKTYAAFERYALELVRRLSAHGNMLLLLYTEGSEPALDALRDSPLAVASFKAWCRARNGDVAIWNKRWATQYTWDNLEPLLPKGASTDRWTDHWRWVADLMVKTHGELARKIKAQVGDKALLGYHEYSLINHDWAKGDSPIPKDNPYDFLSFVHYANFDQAPLDRTEENMRVKLERFRTRYPKMPLLLGESGADSYHFGFKDQAAAAQRVLTFARDTRIGVNWWMWRDFVGADLSQCSYGVCTPDGTPKPACGVMRKIWLGK